MQTRILDPMLHIQSLDVEKMERCFLVAVTIVLLSVASVLAEGTDKGKSKEWSHGPYDKLQPDQTSPTVVIIGSEIDGTTTNGSRTNLLYRGTQSETVGTPGTNAIAPPKSELRTK